MPNLLDITGKLSVTPLLDIHYPAFAQGYKSGILWRLYGQPRHDQTQAQGLLPISYLVTNLKAIAERDHFDEQYSGYLQKEVGFFIGMYHGGILSPETGCLRDDVTTLALLDHPQAERGYNVGRRDTHYSLVSDTTKYTDTIFLEELRQTACDMKQHRDGQDTWFYSMSCLLGSLSIQVFAVKSQELQRWETEYRLFLEKYKQSTAKLAALKR